MQQIQLQQLCGFNIDCVGISVNPQTKHKHKHNALTLVFSGFEKIFERYVLWIGSLLNNTTEGMLTSSRNFFTVSLLNSCTRKIQLVKASLSDVITKSKMS
jgi:hypothetical protein